MRSSTGCCSQTWSHCQESTVVLSRGGYGAEKDRGNAGCTTGTSLSPSRGSPCQKTRCEATLYTVEVPGPRFKDLFSTYPQILVWRLASWSLDLDLGQEKELFFLVICPHPPHKNLGNTILEGGADDRLGRKPQMKQQSRAPPHLCLLEHHGSPQRRPSSAPPPAAPALASGPMENPEVHSETHNVSEDVASC